MVDFPGTSGNDTLVGAVTDDRLFGEAGNDTLDGGAGNDRLYGGQGNDRFLFTGGQGNDIVEVDEGGTDDRVLLGPGITPDEVRFVRGATISTQNDLFVVLDDGTGSELQLRDHFRNAAPSIESLQFADGTTVGLAGGLTFTGGVTNDRLSGSDFDDTLDGGAGNDTLDGGQGNDRYLFVGGQGNDTIVVDDGGADDRVVLGAGINQNQVRFFRGTTLSTRDDLFVLVDDGTGNRLQILDHFKGVAPSIESLQLANGRLQTLAGGLTFRGDAFDNELRGTVFDDTLEGAGGNDELVGGQGNDTYQFVGRAFGHDTIGEDSGGLKDVASFSHLNLSTAYLARIDDSLVVSDKLGRVSAEIQGQYDADGLSVEKLQLGRLVTLDLARGQTFRGSAGADDMEGTRFADTIIGNAGRDELDGGAGIDSYVFGPRWGQDTVSDIGKSFILFEGLTKSQLTFERNGSDLIITRNGSTDSLVLEDYHPARHIIRYVEAGFSKTIFGSGGGDVLWDGGGADVFQGAGGLDKFLFRAASDSPVAKPDTILDFSGDLINLASFDIDKTTAGIQHFDFIGGRVFSGTAGELRFRGGRLEGDVDGDGDADLAVILMNRGSLVTTLDAASLILE